MKGYKSIFVIALLIVTLVFEIITGTQLLTELNHESDYTQVVASCTKNELYVGSLENEFYIIFKADYNYVVGTSTYSFSKYQFLKKTIKLGNTKTVRYNVNKPSELYTEIDTLVIELIIGLIITILGAFFLYRIIIFA